MTQDTQTVEEKTVGKIERKYTVREVLDSLYFEEVDYDGDFDGYIHLTSDLNGSGTQINMLKLAMYGNARYEEGVKAERERMAVWAKEHSKFADAQPVKDDSDARWEIHYAGYREAIGNLIAHLSDK